MRFWLHQFVLDQVPFEVIDETAHVRLHHVRFSCNGPTIGGQVFLHATGCRVSIILSLKCRLSRPWWCHVHPELSSRCPYHHHFVGKQWLLDKYQCQQVWCCCATSDAIVPLQIQQLEGNICDNFAYLLNLAFSSSQPLLFCAESSSKVRSTCRGFPTEASITCLQYNPQAASIDLP